jgi:hypothetical protein
MWFGWWMVNGAAPIAGPPLIQKLSNFRRFFLVRKPPLFSPLHNQI